MVMAADGGSTWTTTMICARRALCNNEQGRKAHRSIAAALGALFLRRF